MTEEKAPHRGKLALRLVEAVLLMAAFQGAKLLLESLINPMVPEDSFSRRMVTASVMLVLAALVWVYARLRKTPLSVFPRPFGKRYVIFTCVAAALLISSPANFTGGYQAILLAVYGSIITPVYEELLFRGYLWNRLDSVLSRSVYTCLWSVALFTVWHLGYMTGHIASGNWTAVAWKLAAGLGYGTVLGFVRLKTKNCYSTMLVHGVLNMFMI